MSTTERQSSDHTAIIIGGGIGVLAAAIGLQDVGLDVEVYEQAQELREVGAGLTIRRNGLEVLECLGGHEAVVRAGASLARSDVRTPDGRRLGRMWHLSNPIAVTARNLMFKYGPNRLMEGALERTVTTDI